MEQAMNETNTYNDTNNNETPAAAEEEELLMIDNGEGAQASAPNLALTDATVEDNVAKLDFLGPIIVNTDGTLSRIPNWNSLTSHEQTNTLRLIAKRNKTRMSLLQQQEEEEEEQKQRQEEERSEGKES